MKKILQKIKRKFLKKNNLNEKEQRHKLVGAAGRWKMKQQFQINFLKTYGLKSNHKFLDIGCGTLRGGIPIIRFLEKAHYYGIDVRQNVLDEAIKELEQEKLVFKNPKLICFDKFEELKIEEKFDAIFAFSVLIHLEDSIVEDCLSFVSKQLSESGVFIANVNIDNQRPTGSWLEFPVMFKSFDFYVNIAKKCNLKVKSLGTIKSLGHNSNDELSDNQIMLEFRSC